MIHTLHARDYATAWVTLLLCMPPPLRAEEKTVSYGLVGLFGAERNDDFREAFKNAAPEIQLVKLDDDNSQVAIRYDVAKLIPNFNPKKPPKEEDVLQRLNNILGTASNHTFRLRPLSTVPTDKLTKVEINIGVLDCKACRYGAYLAVMKIDGVERAAVSSKPSAVTAWIDSAKTDRAALEASLKQVGAEIEKKP